MAMQREKRRGVKSMIAKINSFQNHALKDDIIKIGYHEVYEKHSHPTYALSTSILPINLILLKLVKQVSGRMCASAQFRINFLVSHK